MFNRKKQQAAPDFTPPEPDSPMPEESAPQWMTTFADMMTLLLCFFVLLLSFSSNNTQRFAEMLGSIREALGVQIHRDFAPFVAYSESEAGGQLMNTDAETRQLARAAKKLKGLVTPVQQEMKAPKDAVTIAAERDGVLLRVSSAMVFEPGSARIRDEARPLLNAAARLMKEEGFNLVVRGHTATEEMAPLSGNTRTSERYPTGWELSSARATAALRYILEATDVRPTRIKAVGYAHTRPLVPDTSATNSELNRRLEFYYRLPKGDFFW